MNISLRCPNPDCGKPSQVVDAKRGSRVRCPHCQKSIEVPASARETSTNANGVTASKMPAPAPLPVGVPEKIGRFEIRGILGRGAFGLVYRAFDPQADREVAVKVPLPGSLDDPARRKRFLREARAAAQLRHPNIVPLLEAGGQGNDLYIASELIEGRSLANAIADGSLKLKHKAAIVGLLAEALHYAHEKKIIHRDVKPANVLLDLKNRPHLLDFGLAYRPENAKTLTQDGAMLGTPAYMAPEFISSSGDESSPSATATADQYSLGILFYEMLVGRLPFDGPLEVVLYSIAHNDPAPLRSIDPSIPKDLETICLKAIAKNPANRYSNCQEFAADIQLWLTGEPISARNPSRLERIVRWTRKRPLTAGLIMAVALSLIVGSIVMSGLANWAMTEARRADFHAQRAKDAEAELARAETAAKIAKAQLAAKAPVSATVEKAEDPGKPVVIAKAAPVASKNSPEIVPSGEPIKIAAEQASEFVGKNAIVEFEVRNVSLSKLAFWVNLNSKQDFRVPGNFAASIKFGQKDRAAYGVDGDIVGRIVRVQGPITVFSGTPQIVVHAPSQLTFLTAGKASDPAKAAPAALPNEEPKPPKAAAPQDESKGPLPQPKLALQGIRIADADQFYVELAVSNKLDFPDDLFAASPDLPPAGKNANASRTWIGIHSEDGKYLFGYVAGKSNDVLNRMWVSISRKAPPEGIYVELWDRRQNVKVKSNVLPIKGEVKRFVEAPIAVKLLNLRIPGQFQAGDDVTIHFDLVNISNKQLAIPINGRFHSVGVQQAWIERLGDEPQIPAIPAKIGRKGNKYAAGGSIVGTADTWPPDHREPIRRTLSTVGYPPGTYRYTIDFRPGSADIGPEIQSEFFDFVLR